MRPSSARQRLDLLFCLAAVGLVVLIGITFGSVLHFTGPILDDDHAVALNRHIGSLSAASLEWIARPDFAYNARFMPLGWLGVDLETRITGLNPFRMHAFVLGLHALNSVLLAAVLRRFLRRCGAKGAAGEVWAPLAGAAFYALHPMRAETLGWVSLGFWHQAVFFALIFAWIRLGERRRPWAEAAALLGCLLSFPVCLGLAPAAAAIDWLTVGWRTSLRRNAVPLVLTAACAGMTLYATTVTGAVPTAVPFPRQVLQLVAVEGHVLARSVLPLRLSPFAKPVHDLGLHDPVEVAGSATFVLLWLAAVLPRGRALRPWVAAFTLLVFPFAWTARWYDPDIGNRYSTAAHLLLAAAVAFSLWRALRVSGLAIALAVLLVGTWGVLAGKRIGAWDSDITLEADTARVLPPDDLTYRGSVAIMQGETAICRYLAGDYTGALTEIDGALSFAPSFADFLATRRKIIGMQALVMAPRGPKELPLSIPRVMEHWSIAVAALREGDETRAQVHLAEIQRLDPAFYARVTSP